jgi:trans-2,3-dihydro-3-hydroxyanthranilate isomerase
MRYVTCDVFTDRPFTGNPLAVVLQADGLAEEEMQRIAAEFGYSETTFVCEPDEPGFDARVRIFTPTMELGFAGHPNVGTALVLAEGDRTLRFQEAAGPVAVTVRGSRAEVAAPRAYRVLGEASRERVAAACGIAAADIAGDPVVATCGTPFAVAQVADLRAARPVTACDEHGASGVLLYQPGDPIRARVFAPAAGVPEDPATGSAALVLAGLLAQRDGAGAWQIEQGQEVGRPSRLAVRADGRGATWVAGGAVEMMRGRLTYPHG